jgi:ribosome biogenesis protein SSF1/2
MMSPNSFDKVRESKRNSAQDYVQVAGSLGASHLLRVSNNEKNVGHIHLSKMPAGPCFDFRLERFSLIADLRAQLESGGIALSREDEKYAPIAILSGFKGATDEFAQLLAETLKGLVPSIDLAKINTKTCKRVIVFSFESDSKVLSLRHYRINLSRKSVAELPSASSSSCGVILNARKSSRIPNLGNLVSISELVTPRKQAIEDEKTEIEIVTSKSTRKTTLQLTEVGPRIDASLSRVVSGVEEGTILFSNFAPETIGSTIVKKKPKRVYEPKPKKKRVQGKTDNDENYDDDYMSE